MNTSLPISNAVIKLGEICEVYLTRNHLVKLKEEIERILKN